MAGPSVPETRDSFARRQGPESSGLCWGPWCKRCVGLKKLTTPETWHLGAGGPRELGGLTLMVGGVPGSLASPLRPCHPPGGPAPSPCSLFLQGSAGPARPLLLCLLVFPCRVLGCHKAGGVGVAQEPRHKGNPLLAWAEAPPDPAEPFLPTLQVASRRQAGER